MAEHLGASSRRPRGWCVWVCVGVCVCVVCGCGCVWVWVCVGVCGEGEGRWWWWCGRCASRACLSIPVRACTPGSQTPGVPAPLPEPSMTKNSSSSRAHLALDVQLDEVRKMAVKPTEKPIQTPPSRHNRRSSVPDPTSTTSKRDIDQLVDERHLRNQSSFLHCHDEHPLLHTNRNVNNLVQELPRTPKETRPPYQSTTGMSSTLTMSWNSQGRPQQRQRGPLLPRNPLWGSWARP